MSNFENKCYFKKGEVGNWVNYLTPSMIERLEKEIAENKQRTEKIIQLLKSRDIQLDVTPPPTPRDTVRSGESVSHLPHRSENIDQLLPNKVPNDVEGANDVEVADDI